MRWQTRKLILNIATGLAIAATGIVGFTPAAFAALGTVASNANVRQGPSTDTPVVGTVSAGSIVDIGECVRDFCFIVHRDGVRGFVAARFLNRPGEPASGGVGINVGPGGVSIGIGVNEGRGNGRPGRDEEIEEEEPEEIAEVCFYDRTRQRGDSFCAEEGESIRRLGDWNDRISSFENDSGLDVRVCRERDFRSCRTYTGSRNTLGAYDDDISSIQIR